MPLKVTCPKCAKELKSSDQLAGKMVACPRCKASFRVPLLSDSEQRMSLSAASPPPGRVAGDTVVADPPGAPDTVSRSTPRAGVGAGWQAMAVPPPRETGAPRFRQTPPKIQRRPQRAEFIADETTATRVQLGADGQLPSLVLKDGQKKEPRDRSSPSSNPLLLIGVLCFSITMSVIMLVVEPGGPSRDPRSKTEARRLIEAHYIGNETVEPYQTKLREAIQAFNRGDYRQEQACYREVLNMLHDESIPGVTGLTGMRRDTKPPNDRHLEDLLAILLGRG